MKETSDENPDNVGKRKSCQNTFYAHFFLHRKELMCKIIDVNTSDKFLWRSHVKALMLSIIITAFHLNLCLIEQTPAASLLPSSSLCLLVSLHTSVIYLLQWIPNSHRFCRKIQMYFAWSFLPPHSLTDVLLLLHCHLLTYSNDVVKWWHRLTGSFSLSLLWGLPCSRQCRADSWISRSIPLLL